MGQDLSPTLPTLALSRPPKHAVGWSWCKAAREAGRSGRPPGTVLSSRRANSTTVTTTLLRYLLGPLRWPSQPLDHGSTATSATPSVSHFLVATVAQPSRRTSHSSCPQRLVNPVVPAALRSSVSRPTTARSKAVDCRAGRPSLPAAPHRAPHRAQPSSGVRAGA